MRRQSPEVTAKECELYTIDDGNGGRDREVERMLADLVDGPGQQLLRTLDAGGRLAEDETSKLALFAAALYVRRPAFREQQRQLAEQMRARLIREGVEPAAQPRPSSDPETRRLREPGGVHADELLATLNEAREATRPYQNAFVQMMVGLIPKVAYAMDSLEWLIAYAPPGKAFVTSDVPALVIRPRDHQPLLGVGLLTPGSEKIIPLTSSVALVMGDERPRPTITYVTIDRDRLRRINELLVRQCERFAMGRHRALLESLLAATGIGGTLPPRRSELVGEPDLA